MGEIKSVKVDNWGVFFLQKLQNFFNKTDYCDLTLQFKDNSQLKVHRLVLSACTDFFNVLEHTCELTDDALVMPNELQADVVVPIVNFMYTGTLEFELKMYGKLLKTAKEMNMTVLLKLLEAHRRTMEGVSKAQRPPSPKAIRKRTTQVPLGTVQQHRMMAPSTQTTLSQLRRIPSSVYMTPQRRLAQMTPTANTMTRPTGSVSIYKQQNSSASLLRTPPKIQKVPTRFESTDSSTMAETYEGSFDSISYESKPMKVEPEDYDGTNSSPSPVKSRSSPFEQLRKGYNNNKRPAVTSFISPPAKKPNIEDVKEFAEQQRMRKQIAAEYGDDQEYEGIMDDDIHNDDDDEDGATTTTPAASQTQFKQQQQHTTSIVIKQEPNEKPTIVVKDSTNSKMNHAKIISEVLRQYPHLVKSNKNIKLKIMPNAGGQTQKIIVKKETMDNISSEMENKEQSSTKIALKSQETILKPIEKSTTTISSHPQQQSATISTTNATTIKAATASALSAAPAVEGQKRRIDSKTMHALIAQGAENTTGPWLCLRCGINGRPISIPSYRGFRRHLINTHKETIDPALCEHCGWRSSNNRNLHYHILSEHKITSQLYTFPDCVVCSQTFIDTNTLNEHMIRNHPEENKQQCIYCNKIFAKELQLFNHMKTYHKQRALEDGIIDYSDDEFENDMNEEAEKEPPLAKLVTNKDDKKKIKILSDISLPSTILKLEPSSEAEALSNVASGIATSIGIETEEFISSSDAAGEPKFVNSDGNEMVLTAKQREEIMSQLEQDHEGGVVMVLNETAAYQNHESAGEEDDENDGEADVSKETQEENISRAADQSSAVDETQPDVEIGAEEEEEENAAVDEATSADEEYDENNIYNELSETKKKLNDVKGSAKSEDTNEQNESKESHDDGEHDHMEWAQNLISAHDMEDDEKNADETSTNAEDEEKLLAAKDVEKEKYTDTTIADDSETRTEEVVTLAEKPKKDDEISLKLKMLTGDWSEDETEDEEFETPAKETTNLSDSDVESKQTSFEALTDGVDADIDAKSEASDKSNSGKTNEKTETTSMDTKIFDSDGKNKDLKEMLTEMHEKDADDATKINLNIVSEVDNKNDPEKIADKDTAATTKQRSLSPALIVPASAASDEDITENVDNAEIESEKTKHESNVDSEDDNCKEKLEEESNKEIEKQTDESKKKLSSITETATEVAQKPHSTKTTIALSLSTTVEKTSPSSGDLTKTEDKVKSLISDWGDDDDDEEDL